MARLLNLGTLFLMFLIGVCVEAAWYPPQQIETVKVKRTLVIPTQEKPPTYIHPFYLTPQAPQNKIPVYKNKRNVELP
jgi:hypothetical protein